MQSTDTNKAPVQQKFPGLSTLYRVDQTSSSEERKIPFPIASVSKSFCGTVCASMAVEGKFDDKGINSTLKDVLEYAKVQNPDKIEKIDKYLQMLDNRGFSDVKISELLTHQSGIRDNDGIPPSSYEGKTALEFFSDNLERGNCPRGEYRYSNNGYILLEEIIDLASDKGYKGELKEMVGKLGLNKTGILEDISDKNALEAKQNLGKAVILAGVQIHPYDDRTAETRLEFPANHTSQLGPTHTASGGLYSTAEDLDKYFIELAKLALGLENSLIPDMEKTKQVSVLYRENIGKEPDLCSLGVEFREVELEDGKKGCAMKRTGLFPGNYASVEVEIPITLGELKSGKAIDEDVVSQFRTKIVMSKTDHMVSSLFTKQAEKIPTKMIKDFLNSMLDESEKSNFAKNKTEEIEKYLIEHSRLPSDFSETRDKIYKEFQSAGNKVKHYLCSDYLDDQRVINSKKINEDFRTIEKVNEVLDPIFSEAKENTKKILEEIKKSKNESPSPSPESPRGRIELASRGNSPGESPRGSSGGSSRA